jgi:hypothetical protein
MFKQPASVFGGDFNILKPRILPSSPVDYHSFTNRPPLLIQRRYFKCIIIVVLAHHGQMYRIGYKKQQIY